VGLAVIIGGVGLALWLALQEEQKNGPSISNEKSWGIVTDNPVKQRR
jgi:hypothetical protein